jgi:2-oxoglutarate/2-oxoacid ferredoxin oxidoreductase subunit alpha
MRLSVLIGGKAGQGINKISEIISRVMVNQGYFTFNYRDYPSIIRGGHNFNVLTISNERVGSHESKIDFIIAMDQNTVKIHKKELRKGGIVITENGFEDLGINLNVALAGAFVKILGLEKKRLIKEIKRTLNYPESIKAAEKGFESQEVKFDLRKIKNKISIMSGSEAIALGAINSKLDRYFAYPMTPATGVLHVLANKQFKNNYMVFQPENEIAVVNAALGSSFTGAKTMIGTSGGGFDLMAEGLSLQGITELPLVTYLASRPGPGTGVPTYSTQGDLNIALRSGHGEFPRVVIAPGDPNEAIEKTNEAFYLSNKFNCLSILLGDKHLAESEFSSNKKPKRPLKVIRKGKLPGKAIVKSSSYEHDKYGNTTEDPKIVNANQNSRLKRYDQIKKESKKFEMIKIYGKKNSKKLIIGWGSTKGAILDAMEGTDYKFLQVLYLKPMSDQIKKEIKKANKVVLVENNLTGQLGRIIREKTGIQIKNRILRYDSRPFLCDELRKEIKKVLK